MSNIVYSAGLVAALMNFLDFHCHRLAAKMEIPIAPLSFRWPLSSLAETDASDLVSAACYCGPEHVGITAVIVSELKLGDVERHIFGGHFVECADHATLEDRPETLNRVGMDRADNVLAFAVVNDGVIEGAQIIAVVARRVGRQQTDLVRDGFIDEFEHCLGRDAIQNPRDHVALALYRADDRRLVAAAMAYSLIPVPIAVLAAHPRLVHFHDAAQLDFWLDQGRADFVAHGMGRLVATEAHHALNLEGTHSLLAGEHEVGDPEPVAEGLLGVLEIVPTKAENR